MQKRQVCGRAVRWLGVGLAIGLAPASAGAQTLLSDTFEDGNANGWTVSGGTWSVVTDGSQAYRQSNTGSSDSRTWTGSSGWTNYSVQVRVKPLSWNGSNRFVALLARRQSATSYYYVTLRSSNLLELKKLVSGSVVTLASRSFTVATGTWYTLRLDVNGSSLAAYVNGAQQLTATDTQYTAGDAGVATYFGTASFDDFLVTGVGSTPTPTSRGTATPTTRPTATPTPTTRPTATPTTRPGGGLSMSLVRNTVVSSNATALSSYNTNVNVASYRHQGILYYSGFQFVSWFNGNTRNAIVGRRTFDPNTLAAGAWAWAYVNFILTGSGDSHNVMSLALSPNDGRLHVAIGQHDTQLYYIRTNPGAATGGTWDNTVFGGTAAAPASPLAGLPGYGAATNNVTYPYFMNAGDSARTLQLAYRTGSSGNGRFQLAEYNASTGNWAHLGQFMGSSGSYTQNGVTSTSRNAYPHGFNYDYSGRLHMAYTWRENLGVQFISGCGSINNHDTLYAYSDDRGRTWRNSGGSVVGTTGSDDILISDGGLVVDPLPVGRDLMNQETQMMDRNNLFHAIVSYTPGRYSPSCASNRQQVQPFHVWRNASGQWTKVELRINGQDVNQGYNRSKVFFSSSNNMYVVLPDLRVVGASASTNWTDWALVYDGRSLGGNFGETIIDANLTRLANAVSVLYLRASGGTSELRVLDFTVN